MLRAFGIILLFMACNGAATAAEKDQAWWWDEAWWSEGRFEQPRNYPVETRRTSYHNGDVEVPVTVLRPRDNKKYPGVLFVHGRRGFDDLVELHATRLAARGFIVFAPDLYTGRFISKMPIEHDYALEDDLDKGVDEFLKSKEISGQKVCFYSHTRGGYYTLKVAVTKGRQGKNIACYVSYYPHWQDPNAPEPLQIYSFAPEINDFNLPAMIFIGEDEQYQRKRVIESSVDTLRQKGRPITYIVYPGVGRGFDFRPPNVRTFADDLAAKDAVRRAADFINAALR
ncbi:MAG: dienelactone hydrolase family protein [Gammaproteobacteria bacterium]|nr:dienelactone hydrolase family protein [Gammaproteobacteria bacterium]